MRKFLLFFTFLIPWLNWGQAQALPYTENWDAATTTVAPWTNMVHIFNPVTVLPCQGAKSIRVNLQGNAAMGTAILRSGAFGPTTGGLITFSFDYKWLVNNSGFPAVPTGAPANRLDMRWQWSSSISGPWYTFKTIDASNHQVSINCAPITASFVPPAGDLYLRVVASNTNATGNNFLYLDNFSLTEGAVPTCKPPLKPYIDNKTSTGFRINWSAPAGQTVQEYEWEVRTSGDPGTGTPVEAGTSTTTSANTTVTLAAETTYKVYIRAKCSATDSSEWVGLETTTFCASPTIGDQTINICGIQTVDLAITGGTAAGTFWYDKDGVQVHNNSITFKTPEITEDTKYTVTSGSVLTGSKDIIIGNGLATITTGVPFNANKASKVQYIYLASELKAAGFTKGIIRSFGFRNGATSGTLQRNNFTIHMGLTTLEEFSDDTFIPNSSLKEVKAESDQLLVGNAINRFMLDKSFSWDGVSNIVVQLTYSDINGGKPSATDASVTSFSAIKSNRTLYAGNDVSLLSQMLSMQTGTRADTRVNAYFQILDGCFADLATINIKFKEAPKLVLSTYTVNNCAGSPPEKLYVLTGADDYDKYEWSPNPPANPTVFGDQKVGWTFNPTTNTTYTLKASNSTGDECVIEQEVKVELNPSPTMLQLSDEYNLCFGDIQELKVDNFVNDAPVRHLFNGGLGGVTISNAAVGDAITNDTSLFSEGTGSLKISYGAQTNATVNIPTSVNLFNVKSVVVEFDHIAGLQATSSAVMDYAYLEYSMDNGSTWKPFLATDYTGLASKTLPSPNGQPGLQTMFFTKTSYSDWSTIQQATVPANTMWKSEKFVVPAAAFTGNGTFKLRMRIGADGNTQFQGWYIDNIKITPVSNYEISWSPVSYLYYDQNATIPYDGLTNSGTLYLKGSTNVSKVPYTVTVTNQFGCKIEDTFNVSIGLKKAPVVNDINICGGPIDVANTNFGKEPNGILNYYASATGTATITQITTSGVYYVEQEISGCKSARIPFTVILNPKASVPVATQKQSFCGNATVNDLKYNPVSGFQIKWYQTATGGTALATNAPIANGSYYAEFDSGVCVSDTRAKVDVTIGVTPPAVSVANVSICGTSTISSIKVPAAPGATVNWYQNPQDTAPLAGSTVLATGVYYVAQKIGVCESVRTTVNVTTIQNLPAPTSSAQTFCGSATVGNLVASGQAGTAINWYSFSSSDTPLAASTPLTTGTYYVGQSIGDCHSVKLAVSVKVLSVSAPVINAMSICGDATVSSLPLNATPGLSYRVYTSPMAAAEMGQNDPITTGTYYISAVQAGCETSRTAVSVTVTPRPLAPTGNATQKFVDSADVSKLVMNEPNVVWFASYNDALNNENPLPSYQPLEDGKTYYGVIVGPNGCTSLPTAVKVQITLGTNDLDLAALRYYPNPADSELTVSYKDAIKQIEVYDILGKQVKTQTFDSKEIRLNVSNLAAGTYMVKVKTDAGSQFIKIVKR